MKPLASLTAAFLLILASAASGAPATPAKELSSFLVGHKAGDIINVPTGTYAVNAPVLLTLNGSALLGNGSTLIVENDVNVFDFLAPGIHVDGFNTDSPCGIFAEARADHCTLSNCRIGMNATPGSWRQAVITQGGGTNFTIADVTCGWSASECIYIQENGARLIDCTAHSIAEAPLRFDTPDGKTVPTGITVERGSYSNAGNGPLKQTIEVRTSSVLFIGVAIQGDMVLGQGKPSTPPQTPGQLGQCEFRGCTFSNRTPGNPFLGCRWGSTVMIDATTKWVDSAPMDQLVVAAGGKVTWLPAATQPAK